MKRKTRGKLPCNSARRLNSQKNRIRGIISHAKRRSYTEDHLDRAADFQHQLADALASARAAGGAQADRFLQWVRDQTQAQVPSLRMTAMNSTLSSRTLERVPKSLQAELSWTAKLLVSQSAMLNDFRRAAARLEEAALRGNWSKTKDNLDYIESVHGRSIWLLEAKIAALQAYEGLDAQKQYLSGIRKVAPNSLPAYLGRFFSIRNEPSTTLNSVLSDAEERELYT
jgi:hypothetical protein